VFLAAQFLPWLAPVVVHTDAEPVSTDANRERDDDRRTRNRNRRGWNRRWRARDSAGAPWTSVAVLERDLHPVDQVRGEFMAPRGVTEAARLDLLEILRGTGGVHATRFIEI
jgi:hypothetical protein